MITHLTLSFIGWLLVAVGFEYAYDKLLSSRSALSKGPIAQIYWGALAILTYACGGLGILPQLLMLAPVALSHAELSKYYEQKISVTEILRNMLTLAKRGLRKLVN